MVLLELLLSEEEIADNKTDDTLHEECETQCNLSESKRRV